MTKINDEIVDRLIKERFQAVRKIYHPWNELFKIENIDLEKIGAATERLQEKYKGKINLEICDFDRLFEDVMNKLTSVEPLFGKISDNFRKLIRSSLISTIYDTNNKELGYMNSFEWTLLYFYIVGSTRMSMFDPKENSIDWELWQKIDCFKRINDELDLMVGDTVNIIKKYQDPSSDSFFQKSKELNQKYNNHTNKKVS